MAAAKSAGGVATLGHPGLASPEAPAAPRPFVQPEGRVFVRQLTQSFDMAAILSSYALSYYLHDALFRGIYPPMQPLRSMPGCSG